jgi:peptidoglycan biosynthesis protein MviN/MurJ (putative lipid II flippase)
VVLASLSGTGYGIVVGGWLLVCLLAWTFSRRDVYGRRRATGCLLGLVVFFGAFVVAFAAWAADNIF